MSRVDATGSRTTTRGDRWLIGVWIAAAAIALAGTVHDTDPYWQVRAGEESLDGMPLARPDGWSWAPVDGLFYPNSPAWNVILALAWRALGAWGLYLVTAASIAACLGLVAWLALRLGARGVPTVIVVIATCGAVLPVLSPRAGLAAQTIFLFAVAVAVGWADRAGRHSALVDAAVPLVAGFVLSVVGNWVHLSWSTLAFAAAAAWAAIWLLTPGLGAGRRTVLVVGGTVGLVAGVVAGPYGVDVTVRTQAVVDACRGIVIEWIGPFSADFGARWWPLAVGGAAFLVGTFVWCIRALRRRPPDRRLPVIAALAVSAAPYAIAGFAYIRFILVAVPLLAPVAAAAVTVVVDRLHARVTPAPPSAGYFRRRVVEWTTDRFWRVIAWAVLVVLSPLVLFAGSRHAEPATQGVNDLLPVGCREFGTPLEAASIIVSRPDVKVWIDGRADYWGRERNLLAQDYLYEVNQPTLVPPGTTCVVLGDLGSDPELAALTAALDADPAWQRVPGTTGANLWVPAP